MGKKPVKKRKKKSQGKALLWMFIAVCVLLVFEIVWISQTTDQAIPGSAPANPIATATAEPTVRPTDVPTQQPTRQPTPKPTEVPTPVPTAEPTAVPTVRPVPTLLGVYPDEIEGFLPVCNGRETDRRIVALTIDDCNQAANLRKMIDLIDEYGGEATIFPIGENVTFLGPTLRRALDKGFEIENHTQSHKGLYAETDEEMAYQIWQQNYEVSQALGVNYQMHFLRPRGGDNKYDQRTHAYMRQMGYSGIAYWSQVGSNNTADALMRNLKPGDIILFHTTNQDLEVIEELVPRLYRAGYDMVTLNDMFGLEDNEQTELTEQSGPMPLIPYERFDQILKRGDYLHDVLLMQERLSELGYLNSEYNGFFGGKTENALKAFQTAKGLEADGQCGPMTWNALFED